MAENTFTIEVDTAALEASLLKLSWALKPFIKTASQISAANIAREMRARLQRQLSGTSTGRTVAGIGVKPDRSGWGAVVLSGNAVQPMLPRWLETGTTTMAARDFFWASARLEEGAHHRRIKAAVMAGLSEHGIGQVTP
jgi:hypothetical protein